MKETMPGRSGDSRSLAASLNRAEQRERERIARVLHDDLQQLLYGAQMRLALLREELFPAADATHDGPEHLAGVERLLEDAVQLTRRLNVDLAPPTLMSTDLTDTVRWLADQMQDVHGLRVELALPDELCVDAKDVRDLVYQVLRELLFNVVKHAGTHDVIVSLDVGDQRLELRVEDHGNGFDADEVTEDPNRRGITTLRERLELGGGDLRIRSVPGDGTVAVAAVPVEGITPAPEG